MKSLRIVNVLLGIDFLIIAVTALFNNPIQYTGYYYFVHAIPGFIFLALVLIHLYLNRRWIKNNYTKKKDQD